MEISEKNLESGGFFEEIPANRPPNEKTVYNPLIINGLINLKVILLGLEPRTYSLEGCCSIQLSYRTFSKSGLQKYQEFTKIAILLSVDKHCNSTH